jgi:hypothetical protein
MSMHQNEKQPVESSVKFWLGNKWTTLTLATAQHPVGASFWEQPFHCGLLQAEHGLSMGAFTSSYSQLILLSLTTSCWGGKKPPQIVPFSPSKLWPNWEIKTLPMKGTLLLYI